MCSYLSCSMNNGEEKQKKKHVKLIDEHIKLGWNYERLPFVLMMVMELLLLVLTYLILDWFNLCANVRYIRLFHYFWCITFSNKMDDEIYLFHWSPLAHLCSQFYAILIIFHIFISFSATMRSIIKKRRICEMY